MNYRDKMNEPTKEEIHEAMESCDNLIIHLERIHESILLRKGISIGTPTPWNIERRSDLRNVLYPLREARKALDTYERRWIISNL